MLAYPARHIHWKIIAPYVLLTIILAGAGTFIAARLVTSSLKERFDNQLVESARVASDSVVRRERQHLEVVRGVAFTDGVAQAVEAGDSKRLLTLVQPLAANNKAELVQVLDTRGQPVLGVRLTDPQTLQYAPLAATDGEASWSIVQGVLAGKQDNLGDKFAQIAGTTAGYALYTAGPIYDGNRLAGVVLVGSLLDSFLPIAKGEALADITIYDFNGTPLATTFPAADKGEAPLAPGKDALAQFGAPAGLKESKTLFGRGFALLYGELTVRNQVVGVYSVALPTSFILSAGGSTRWQMGLLFASGDVGGAGERVGTGAEPDQAAAEPGEVSARRHRRRPDGALRSAHRGRDRRARGFVRPDDRAPPATAPGHPPGADVRHRRARSVHRRPLGARGPARR